MSTDNLNFETGAIEDYAGWEPIPGKPLARCIGSVNSDQFYKAFVSKRRPCVIENTTSLGPDWKADKWTSMAHLRALAGSSTVKIEPIGQAGSFGTSAPRKSTSFASYLDLMKNKEESEKWYLTTQYEEEQDEEGEESGEELDEEIENGDLEDKIIQDSDEEEEALQRMLDQETSKNNSNSNSTPQIQNSDEVMEDGDGSSEEDEEEDENEEAPPLDPLLPSPTDALISEFPPQPELLGSLVLSQCNLWLGGCKDGKSSGLHHDFHDNLYVLLSGHKRFLLFPPSAYKYLHPRGETEHIHPNGLITYTPPDTLPYYYPQSTYSGIRADGLPPLEAALWRLSARRRTLQEAEDNAARLNGEEHRVKKQRKGKGKMTSEMEEALKGVRLAENELRLFRLQEDGSAEFGVGGEETDEEESEEEEEEEEDEEEEGEPQETEVDYEASDEEETKNSSFPADQDDESSDHSSVSIDSAEMQEKIDEFPPDILALIYKFHELDDDDQAGKDEISDLLKPYMDAARLEITTAKTQKKLACETSRGFKTLEQLHTAGIDLDILQSMIDVAGGEINADVLEAMMEAQAQKGGRTSSAEENNEEAETENLEGEDDGEVEEGESGEEEDTEGAESAEEGDIEGGESGEEEEDDEGWRFFDEIEKERMREEDREAGMKEGNYDTGDSLEVSDDDEEDEASEPEMTSGNGKRKRGANGHQGQAIKAKKGNKKSKTQKDPSPEEEVKSDSSIPVDSSSDETSDSEPLFPPGDAGDEENEEDEEEGIDWKLVEEGEALVRMLGNGSEEKEKLKDEKQEEKNEPQSFSKIKPEILHAFFNIPNKSEPEIEVEEEEAPLTKTEKRKLKKQRKQEARKARRGQKEKSKVQNVKEEKVTEDVPLLPLKGCPEPLVVDLKPGEMLYLPASWYHEVTSSAAPSDPQDDDDDRDSNVHMAFNYWMHPPDALYYYEIQPLPPAEDLKKGKKGKKVAENSKAVEASAPTLPDLPAGAPLRFAHRTGCRESPYRDVEVWNEIRTRVQEEIESCKRRDVLRRQVEGSLLAAKSNGKQNGSGDGEEEGEEETESLEDRIMERLGGLKNGQAQGKKRERDEDPQVEEEDSEEEKALEEILQKEMARNRGHKSNGEKRKNNKKKT